MLVSNSPHQMVSSLGTASVDCLVIPVGMEVYTLCMWQAGT